MYKFMNHHCIYFNQDWKINYFNFKKIILRIQKYRETKSPDIHILHVAKHKTR
jgi:hypothetical protein